MKRLIIDEYRRRATQKRGSTHGVEPLSPENAIFNDGFNTDLLDLDRSLRRLEEIDSVKSRIVELRFFGGCTVRQVAAAIGMSSTAVAREWNLARAWLYRDLNDRTSTVERSDG